MENFPSFEQFEAYSAKYPNEVRGIMILLKEYYAAKVRVAELEDQVESKIQAFCLETQFMKDS